MNCPHDNVTDGRCHGCRASTAKINRDIAAQEAIVVEGHELFPIARPRSRWCWHKRVGSAIWGNGAAEDTCLDCGAHRWRYPDGVIERWRRRR